MSKKRLDEPDQAIKRLDDALLIEGLTRTSICPGPDQFFFQQPQNARAPESLGTATRHALSHSQRRGAGYDPLVYQRDRAGNERKWSLPRASHLTARQCFAHQVNCGPRREILAAHRPPRIVHNPLATRFSARACPR